MLHSYFFSSDFKKAAQSGFYIDFFLKNIFENIIRNALVYTAQFFCEKYVIEYFTKKIFVNITYLFNQLNKSTNFNITYFFTQLIIFIFYFGFVLNIILILI